MGKRSWMTCHHEVKWSGFFCCEGKDCLQSSYTGRADRNKNGIRFSEKRTKRQTGAWREMAVKQSRNHETKWQHEWNKWERVSQVVPTLFFSSMSVPLWMRKVATSMLPLSAAYINDVHPLYSNYGAQRKGNSEESFGHGDAWHDNDVWQSSRGLIKWVCKTMSVTADRRLHFTRKIVSRRNRWVIYKCILTHTRNKVKRQ